MLKRLPELPLFAKLDIGAAVLALDEMSKVVNAEAPWEEAELPFTGSVGPQTTREADQMSLQTWMDLNLSSQGTRPPFRLRHPPPLEEDHVPGRAPSESRA